MPVHRLTEIAIGVPDVELTADCYTEFGLTPTGTVRTVRFATEDGNDQLTLKHTARRRPLSLEVGIDDPDDVERVGRQLIRSDVDFTLADGASYTHDPITGVEVVKSVAPRLAQAAAQSAPHNRPGFAARPNVRAPGIDREHRVRPRKLGHVVFGSTDQAATQRFFTQGIGFKVSDEAPGMASFMRCSADHHNVLVVLAQVGFLHHTSWEVDEVGRDATSMLEGHPERHALALGQHHVGSDFLWYLRDPAGTSYYYSDMDCILDVQLWEPRVVAGEKSPHAWSPPPPPSFLAPEDLAELMTDAHWGAR